MYLGSLGSSFFQFAHLTSFGSLTGCYAVFVFGGAVVWSSSDRRSRLPSDWASRRLAVFARDRSACQWRLGDGRVCGAVASEVDHVVAGDDHSLSNLRALCSTHHRAKSSGEGWAARQAGLARSRGRFRWGEEHPSRV